MKKTKRKVSSTKKKSPALKKRINQLKRTREKFLKHLGCLSFFLLIFCVLLFLVIYKWTSRPNLLPSPDDSVQIEQAKKEAFVEELVPTAQAIQREYGILASVSLAQAMLESDFGRSQLASVHKNLYGVKTSADDPQSALYPTLEFYEEEWVEINDYFKVYPSWQASMKEHAQLMVHGTSWNPNQYQTVLAAQDFYTQAQALQSSGYATDPDYAQKLINMIEDWQLHQYDQPTLSNGGE